MEESRPVYFPPVSGHRLVQASTLEPIMPSVDAWHSLRIKTHKVY